VGGAGRHRARFPGNVDMITGSALTPVLESVAALPAGHPADLPVTKKIHQVFHPGGFGLKVNEEERVVCWNQYKTSELEED